jgi:hypothetical protein
VYEESGEKAQMKLSKNMKNLIAVFAIVVIGFVAIQHSAFQVPMSVLSVDRIYLAERGVGSAGQELSGGVWRVLATTKDNTEVKFLSMNDSSMSGEGIYSGDFPSDVDVTGSIYVQVSQEDKPYYFVPIVKVGDVTVCPSQAGTSYTAGSTPSQVSGISTTPVFASIWKLDMARKQVYIPFRVVVAKTFGENTGYFQTSDPKATQLTSVAYQPYKIVISQSAIVNGEQSSIIVFTNPKDSSETVKVNLVWSFADYDQYSLNTPLMFVTASGGGPIEAYNTFNGYDETAIIEQLNWQSGSAWTFNNYWFGGGNAFLGTSQRQGGLGDVATWTGPIANGVVKTSNVWVTEYVDLLCEGYVSGTTRTNGIYEYPGWYAPFPDNGEGQAASVNPQNLRYPVQAQLTSDYSSKPVGYGVLNYLASNVKAPISNQVHTAFSRVNPDVWGHGKAGYAGAVAFYQLFMPIAARNWLFTLDVSTEACDTVVVQQSYIDVAIQSFSIDKTTLQVGETATVTAILKNNAGFGGTASVGLLSPGSLQMVASTTGGDGNLAFAAGETKTVSIQVKNTGMADADTSGSFTFKVTNTEGRITASRAFDLLFKAGLSIADSQVLVKTLAAATGQPVGGLTAKIEYGQNSMIQGSTGANGETLLNLQKYDGTVKITAFDPSQKYLSQSQTVAVKAGVNGPFEFRLEQGVDVGGFDLTWVLFGAVALMGFALVFTQRRKLKFRRR